MSNRALQELKKLHKLVIHEQQKITDDKEWYRLARKETRHIAKATDEDCSTVCSKCFG